MKAAVESDDLGRGRENPITRRFLRVAEGENWDAVDFAS